MKGKKTGSCSSRSPYRPNSLGMSLLKLERIEDYKIYVSGVDVVDGTPIVDIKPYTMYDRLESFKQPDWISESNQTLTTSFSYSIQHQLSVLLEESPSNFYGTILSFLLLLSAYISICNFICTPKKLSLERCNK